MLTCTRPAALFCPSQSTRLEGQHTDSPPSNPAPTTGQHHAPGTPEQERQERSAPISFAQEGGGARNKRLCGLNGALLYVNRQRENKSYWTPLEGDLLLERLRFQVDQGEGQAGGSGGGLHGLKGDVTDDNEPVVLVAHDPEAILP